MVDGLRTTPLYGEHLRLGAKMVPFAGYSMPIQYPAGIRSEHLAVRQAAGLFDVSHMGEFEVAGSEALAFIQRLTVNDASRLVPGQAQYSLFCREDGGVLDDLLVYRLEEYSFLLVVNGANRERGFRWLESHRIGFDVRIRDRSDETAILALQGPVAERILAPLVDADLSSLSYYHSVRTQTAGSRSLVARTGYTGEDGFEVYVSARDAPGVWRAILDTGEPDGLVPAGLGCRDSLRLEMGYPLHGGDLDEAHTAIEAGMAWVVKLEKPFFLGRETLARQKAEGVARRLVGIRLIQTGFPRKGYPVIADGEVVGEVTSGTVSPTLGEGIALAYVRSGVAEPRTPVAIRIRDRDIPGVVQRTPFYSGGSLKR